MDDTTIDTTQRSCELCGLGFDRDDAFQEHMRRHVLDVDALDADVVFECENCQRSFLSADDLERHGQRVHPPISME